MRSWGFLRQFITKTSNIGSFKGVIFFGHHRSAVTHFYCRLMPTKTHQPWTSHAIKILWFRIKLRIKSKRLGSFSQQWRIQLSPEWVWMRGGIFLQRCIMFTMKASTRHVQTAAIGAFDDAQPIEFFFFYTGVCFMFSGSFLSLSKYVYISLICHTR